MDACNKRIEKGKSNVPPKVMTKVLGQVRRAKFSSKLILTLTNRANEFKLLAWASLLGN